MAKRRAKYQKILENVIRQGIQEGTFRPVDPALTASALHSMMTMPFYNWLRQGEAEVVEAVADKLVDLFLFGAINR